jgi:hypothetical protein
MEQFPERQGGKSEVDSAYPEGRIPHKKPAYSGPQAGQGHGDPERKVVPGGQNSGDIGPHAYETSVGDIQLTGETGNDIEGVDTDGHQKGNVQDVLVIGVPRQGRKEQGDGQNHQ